MADRLAQYRRQPLNAAAETPPPKGTDEYVAFEVKDKVDRLTINRASAPARSPAYAYLLDVTYDGPHGTNFTLLYTFLIVLVRGNNLQPVVNALKMGTAHFIQEFDPEQWEKPKDAKAPIIESIEVIVRESGPDVADSEKSGKTVH